MNLNQPFAHVPEWKRPRVTWQRVRVLPNCSGFLYRTQAGDMRTAEPGAVIVIDSELAEQRRRNIEIL